MRILVRKQSQRPSTGPEVPPPTRNAENYAPRTSIAQAVDIMKNWTNAQNRTAHLLRALTKTRVIFIRKNAIQVPPVIYLKQKRRVYFQFYRPGNENLKLQNVSYSNFQRRLLLIF